jgi:beta-aspartyl-peptidase (threonine type)
VDRDGVLAAATSTGGVTMKLVGRVGDSPLVGAGNYATPHAAISATGTGEFVMRSLAGRDVAERVARGESLEQAMGQVLDGLGRDFDADVGLIAIDRHGVPVARHRTHDMPHALFSGDAAVTARMRVA